jgi:ketosteroid isomerase-like protein
MSQSPRSYQAVNDDFYRAFATADIAAMESLWAETLPAFCCHPGWPPILGRDEILTSWREILRAGGQVDITFLPRQMALVGDVAIACGIELLGQNQFACTNIFAREGGHWRMVHHQAGPMAPAAFVPVAPPADPGRNTRH